MKHSILSRTNLSLILATSILTACGGPAYVISGETDRAFLVVHPRESETLIGNWGVIRIYPDACPVSRDNEGYVLTKGPYERLGPKTVEVPAGRTVIINAVSNYYPDSQSSDHLTCSKAIRVVFKPGETYELTREFNIRSEATSNVSRRYRIRQCTARLSHNGNSAGHRLHTRRNGTPSC